MVKEKNIQKLYYKCLKYLDKAKHKGICLLFNSNYDNVQFLDTINVFLYDSYVDGCLEIDDYKDLLSDLDNCYKKEIGYANVRVEGIVELRKADDKITIQEQQRQLISLFNTLNKYLELNKIDYFHASGFLCYLLVNRALERYHHDIDLYVNVEDITKIKKVFDDDVFKLIHTFEKSSNNAYRHGYKIINSLNDIPIWLSFYKKVSDGSIYVQEYFQETNDDSFFTMQNYNSKKCCKLSLLNSDDIKFNSLSLEALYLSKNGNRKKDIYDCKVIEKYLDFTKVEELKMELTDEWSRIDDIPDIIKKDFFDNCIGENKYEKVLTKK